MEPCDAYDDNHERLTIVMSFGGGGLEQQGKYYSRRSPKLLGSKGIKACSRTLVGRELEVNAPDATSQHHGSTRRGLEVRRKAKE